LTSLVRGDASLVALIRGLRDADPDISALEIADALYLSAQLRLEQSGSDSDKDIPPLQRGEGIPGVESALEPNDPRSSTGASSESRFDTNIPQTDVNGSTERPASEGVGLYADITTATGRRARRVRAPGGRALSDPLGLMRALRPLMRRVPSRTFLVVDVDATVQHVAEAQVARVRVWSPVLRPLQERWLSIDLICDSSPSMRPWQETVDEFRQLLERAGGFRGVRGWRWDPDHPSGLRREGSTTRRAALPTVPTARLVLVVTDCLHSAWRDQRAMHRLAEWAAQSPVAILQVLPEYLWNRTALADFPSVMARQAQPSQSNRGLLYTPLRSQDDVLSTLLDSLDFVDARDEEAAQSEEEDARQRPVAIPVVTLTSSRLQPWARMVAGRAAPAVRAVLAAPRPMVSDTSADATAWIRTNDAADSGEQPGARARRLVEAFRGYASPGGRRLATCLTATAPVTLSIMRVVRDALVAAPSESHIAELLMSGFFLEIPGAGPDTAYVWEPGVHERLSLGLTESDFAAVTDAVTRWMGATVGSSREMTALTLDPSGAERMAITNETRPFAYLYAENLRRLHRPAEADRLTARADAHATVRSPDGLDLQCTLKGHHGVIFRMVWSPDGQWLLTPSVDGTIRIWEATSGRLVDVITVSDEGINEIAWLRGGTRFAAACHDGYLRLWDITRDAGLKMVGSVGPHYTDIRSAAGSPDGSMVAIGCENGLARVYADTGDQARTLATLDAAVPVVSWSADGIVVAGDVHGNVHTFDLNAHDARHNLKTGGPAILSLSSSKREAVACGDDEGNVIVWRVGGTRSVLLARPRAKGAHSDTVTALAFSPEGLLLASKGMDGQVRFWRTDTWALAAELSEPNGNFVLAGLAWHPTSPLLATLGDHDRAVRVWRIDMERLLPVPVVLPRTRPAKRQQPEAVQTAASDAARQSLLSLPQERRIVAIVNIFERGDVEPKYREVTATPGDSGILYYGDGQISLGSGNLLDLVRAYVESPGARFSTALQPYLIRIEAKDSSLATDLGFRQALDQAGTDPVMQRLQEKYFRERYIAPAVEAARHLGITTPLGVAVIYDSLIHGSFQRLRDEVNKRAGTPQAIGEKKWVESYVTHRREWLATHSRKDLRVTVYRMDAFLTLITENNWDLRPPLNVRGVIIEDSTIEPSGEPELRAFEIDERTLGADPNVARDLNSLAALPQDTNRLAEAETLMRRALASDEATLGPNHPDVAIRLITLAALVRDTDRLAEAEPLMRRALEIDETTLGSEHPSVARDLNSLATLLQGFGRLEEAEPLLRRALAIDERTLGPEHPRVARDLNSLATLLQDLRRLEEAEPLMRRALAIDEATLGPGHPNESETERVVSVFFGTDRNVTGPSEPAKSYDGKRGEVSYGVVDVSIPRDHRMGELESPSLLRLQFRQDVARHVVVQRIEAIMTEAFVARLRKAIRALPRKEVLIFVHGYNVTFEVASRRTAQLNHDLNFAGLPFLYSWPSEGTTTGYVIDESNIAWTTPHFTEVLRLALVGIGARAIHVIAHGMGARCVAESLAQVKYMELGPDVAVIGQIMFVVPDIDAQIFTELASNFPRVTGRITLYASSDDRALMAAGVMHRYPRAGDSGQGILVAEGVDTIDATGKGTNLMAHSSVSQNMGLLADMFDLLQSGRSPDQRFGLMSREKDGKRYYAFTS